MTDQQKADRIKIRALLDKMFTSEEGFDIYEAIDHEVYGVERKRIEEDQNEKNQNLKPI